MFSVTDSVIRKLSHTVSSRAELRAKSSFFDGVVGVGARVQSTGSLAD